MAEVFGILGAQKRALVMVEPPRQIRMRRIFEIDDDIDVTVEKPVFEELISAMGETRIHEARALVELAL
jgi:hypothetical protein